MALYIPDTVEVNVFLDSAPSSNQSFEYPMVVIPHNLSTNDVDTFSSRTSVQSAGAAINSPAYQFASGCFGGIAAPALFKIARADLESVDITVDSIPAEDEVVSLNVTVNGISTITTHVVTGVDDVDSVATALQASLDTQFPSGDPLNPVFTVVANVVTATIPANGYKASFGWNSLVASTGKPHIIIEDITSDSVIDTLTTALAQDDDVAFIMAESHDPADVVALSTFAQSSTVYQYFSTTSDINSADSGNTSNIAFTLSLLQQNKVSLQYSAVAEQYFPEAYLVGGFAAISPYRLNNQYALTMAGVPVDTLTEQQKTTLSDRNTNYYIVERGRNVYREGWTMSGQFIDYIRFSIWLKEATEQTLFDLIYNESNAGRALPYSDEGSVRMKQRVINDVINVGIRGGTVATGVSTNSLGQQIVLDPIVDFGSRADQTNADIGNRVWNNGLIEVVYISGVNHINVNAYVILNRDPQL